MATRKKTEQKIRKDGKEKDELWQEVCDKKMIGVGTKRPTLRRRKAAKDPPPLKTYSKLLLGREKIPPVRPPTILQTLFLNRNVKRSVYYFTMGRDIPEEKRRDVNNEVTPFWYPKDNKIPSYKAVEKAWYQDDLEKEKKRPLAERGNFRSRQRSDLLPRLNIPEGPNEADEVGVVQPEGILDLDPEFFSMVEGRPTADNEDMKIYMGNIRATFRARLLNGFLKGEILQMDEHINQERKQIMNVRERYKSTLQNFESFLAEDHKASMKMIKQCEKEADRLEELDNEIKDIEKIIGTLRREVIALEEEWRNSKLFQKFLYIIAPMWWRREHDYVNPLPKADLGDEVEQSKMSILELGQPKLSTSKESSTSLSSIDRLIVNFERDVVLERPPVLYFKDPSELAQVLKHIEIQNLNSLTYAEEISKPLMVLHRTMLDVQSKMNEELDTINEQITNLNNAILWEEQRAEQLKKEADLLLNGTFKEIVTNPETLRLESWVEEVYEECIAPNDANLSGLQMMHSIETFVEQMMMQMDYIPREAVARAEKKVYSEHQRMVEMQDEMYKEYMMTIRMLQSLRRALAPPPPKLSLRRLMWRSDPPRESKKGGETETSINMPDKLYLELFTDYCHHYDKPEDYSEVLANRPKGLL